MSAENNNINGTLDHYLFARTLMTILTTMMCVLTSNCRSTDVVVAKRASTTVMAITAEEICKLDSFIMMVIIYSVVREDCLC